MFLGLLLTTVFLATSFGLFSSSMPEPYKSIKLLPVNSGSLYSNASQIEEVFRKNNIKVVVEVGSWIGGGSTKHMGEILKGRQGILYAVDTWRGSEEHQVGQYFYEPILNYLYQQFLSNMIHWNLTDVVVPIRMKSLEAARALNVRPDLVYIDGDHSTDSVYEDLVAWYPFVKGTGILCGDDWTWETARLAVEIFASENNLLLEASGNFWILRQ